MLPHTATDNPQSASARVGEGAADVVVVGAGPAGLALIAELARLGLNVTAVAPHAPDQPWPNTYGIWADELEPLGLTNLLAQCWDDCSVYFYDATGQARETALNRTYALIDNQALQHHLLAATAQGAGHVQWVQGYAADAVQEGTGTTVTLRTGETLRGRIAVDAGGHAPVLLQRPAPTDPGADDVDWRRAGHIAYQTAYGIVGRFSAPPVRPGQLVLMDYRADHLREEERRHTPPTFLYAMDLGNDRYFVEETCLAHAPAVSLTLLAARLERRLAAANIEVRTTEHVERCLFPMNLPLPDLRQAVVGFGGAASMVHPASGYQVGAALHRAPVVADALAAALAAPRSTTAAVARAGWQAVWPRDRLRRHQLYRFGLQNVLAFDEQQLHAFFTTFFGLPPWMWQGYLSNTLTTSQLMQTMLTLFGRAPRRVRTQLVRSIGSEYRLLGRALAGRR